MYRPKCTYTWDSWPWTLILWFSHRQTPPKPLKSRYLVLILSDLKQSSNIKAATRYSEVSTIVWPQFIYIDNAPNWNRATHWCCTFKYRLTDNFETVDVQPINTELNPITGIWFGVIFGSYQNCLVVPTVLQYSKLVQLTVQSTPCTL